MAWKGMLDDNNCLKEGWLLGLKCYQFQIVEDLSFLGWEKCSHFN